MSLPANACSFALLRAWLQAESDAAPVALPDFEAGLAWLQSRPRRRPEPPADAPWLRLWAALPPGARDLLVLRVLAGFELARIAELQGRPLARVEREWLLLGRRLATRDPTWPAALRQAFLRAYPSPAEDHRGLRGVLGVAALVCFVAAVFAPELHYTLLLDPVQQRLQAPPAVPPPVVEQVPLSDAAFELWVDEVDFDTLQGLDFLLWRLQESGGESVRVEAPVGDPEGSAKVPVTGPSAAGTEALPDLPALAPWAGQWPSLQSSQRALLLDRAQRWQALSVAGRERFEQRVEAYRALSPLLRADLRDRHARWRELDAATRATLRALQAGVAAAAPDQQAALRQQFQALPQTLRRGLLAGKSPELAALAREAFAFVPAEEREATVALLRALSEAEHALLRRLARRLDPAARERLRAELLAADVERRGAVIRERAAAVGLRAD